MNLPTFAIILEDHILDQVYGASKVIQVVNDLIPNEQNHIHLNMSGHDINNVYRKLNYREQQLLQNITLYDEVESNILINQIGLLNASSNKEITMEAKLRDLILLFITTTIVVTTLVVCLGYYENSRQNNSIVESKIFSLVTHLFDNLTIP